MGIFSSQEIRTHGVAAVGLFDTFPEILEAAVLSAILNNYDIIESLQYALLNGYNLNLEKYYDYGRDHYPNGLPSAKSGSAFVQPQAIEDVITGIVGEPIHIDAIILDLANPSVFAQEHFNRTGFPDSFPPNYIKSYDGVIATHLLNLEYQMSAYSPGYIDFKKVTRVAPFPNGTLYYHVQYTLDSDPNKDNKIIWLYDPATKKYPTLNITAAKALEGFYYPIVPLRINFEDIDRDEDHELFQANREILDIIQVDATEITAQYRDTPDSDEIDDVFIIFALDIFTQEQSSLRYLYKYFDILGSQQDFDAQNFFQIYLLPNSTPPFNSVDITDKQFKYTITFGYIEHHEKNEVIGKVGFTTSTVRLGGQGPTPSDPNEPDTFSGFTLPGTLAHDEPFFTSDLSRIIFKQQITENTTRTVEVVNLDTYRRLFKGDEFINNLRDKEGEGLIIPLHRGILKSFSGRVESEIAYDAAHLVIHSVHIEKLAFYETEAFSSFISIVGTVVAFYFAIPALLAIQTLQQLAVFVIKQIISFILSDIVLEFLAEKLGVLGALIGAVAATVAFSAGKFKTTGLKGLPWAETLIKAVSVFNTGLKLDLKFQTEALIEESEEFLKDAGQKQEELEMAYDFLGDDNAFKYNPFEIGIRSTFDPNETPAQFYSRTLDNNPGLYGIDAIQHYVDGALLLPQPNFTQDQEERIYALAL